MAVKVTTSVKLKGGEEIPTVSGVSINQYIDRHNTFQFSVKVVEEIDLVVKKANEYIGQEVEIIINSAKTEKKQDFIFIGIITDLGFSNSIGGTHELIFRGFSPTVLLDDGMMTRSFSKKNLKKIVDTIIKPIKSYFSKKAINPNWISELDYSVQYEESNYHFLSRLAQQYGEWFFYDGEQFIFGKLPSSEAVELQYGKNISNLDLSLHACPSTFQFLSYNYEKNETWATISTNTKSSGLDKNNIGKSLLTQSDKLYSETPISITPQVKNQEELKKHVTNLRGNLENQMVSFSGNSDFPKIKVGAKIKVIGQEYSTKEKQAPDYGEYIVIAVTHVAGGGNYQNRFEAIPASVTVPPINRNIRPTMASPQIGVVKYNDDKDKMGRVRVQLLWQQDTPELTPWIRVVSNYAGKNRGLYILPEIDEEVIVHFDLNDPDKPYGVGSFYHGKVKPEKWFDKNNDKKVFCTKSGNQIEIIDTKGKETIKIFNPKEKNAITLSLDGEAQITIETEGKLLFKAKDIEMESKTLSISASKSIDIETKQMLANASQEMELSTQQMTLDGGQSLEMKGMQSKLESATAEIKGSAKLDLDGGAMASLKGALVKIN